MPEELTDDWHEAGHLEFIYSKLLEIRKRGKVLQGASTEVFRSEPSRGIFVYPGAESFYEWK